MVKILVNCALPYSNSSLHLGHIAGSYISADVFVRYHRLSGDEVLYVSGSDEHGTPITLAAEKLGVSPREIADRYHNEHLETFRRLDINFDIFTRTTYQEHQELCDEFILDLKEKGLLREHEMISPFCITCNRFLPDRYIEGTCPYCGYESARGDQCDNCGRTLDPQELKDPRCIISGDRPEFRETTHLFFALDMFQDRLLKWLDDKNYWKQNVLTYTRNFISSGLKERPVTRDIEWGLTVPLEGFEKKRVYVWFEALMGYISGAMRYSKIRGKPDLWKNYYMDENVRGYYFLGKDNIPFHTIIWPAMIMARGGINLPYNVPANEYLTYKGQKFSKSRKIGFTVNEMLEVIPKDYLRFYLCYNLPEFADSDFDLEDVQNRVNTELIDKFGNFINRVLEFIRKKSIEVNGHGEIRKEDLEFISTFREGERKMLEDLEKVEIKKALFHWLELVKKANQYLNDSGPWNLIKTDPELASTKLFLSLVLARDLTILINPFIPESSDKILLSLGSSSVNAETINFKVLGSIEDRFSPDFSGPPFTRLDLSSYNPNGLDIRTGTVLSVEDHPSADRLLVLKVSLGYRIAQIVAGLKGKIDPDQLRGKKVAILDNIKWAKLRGVESQGMILAADDGERVIPIYPANSEAKDGTEVKIGGFRYNGKGKIEKDSLGAYNLHIIKKSGRSDVVALIDGEEFYLNTGDENLICDDVMSDGSKVR